MGRVTATTQRTIEAPAGVGGFFRRAFAPKGLARIHDGVLANLETAVHA